MRIQKEGAGMEVLLYVCAQSRTRKSRRFDIGPWRELG